MGLVFCFFPTTHKQEKEEFQIFSNKYFFSFLYMTICRTVFILTVNAFQQDTFCSFLLALRVRTMNFADLDMFYEGLLSMAPKGVWLPFCEVVHMAQSHSWSLEGCKVAAHMWSHLGGVELDPPSDKQDSQIVPQRIRLLYQPDMDTRGVVDVSSDEEPCSSGSASSFAKFRRWKTGILQPEAGVAVEITFSQPLDRHDAMMLPTYYSLYVIHQLDQFCRSYNLGPDIPPWAFTLFASPGFTWTTSRVKALQQSLLDDLEAQEDPVPNVAPQIRQTKWGRCNLPNCSQRAFRPIMGSRGPFLKCSRQKCHRKRDLTPQEWSRLPRSWQELWPVNWCNIPFHRRPCRPVASLRRPRRYHH